MDITDRDFFKKPFTRAEIENLLAGKPASDMFNVRSPSFKKLGLDMRKLDDQKMIDWMLKEPRLIRRPAVQIGRKVYFGATETVLTKILETTK